MDYRAAVAQLVEQRIRNAKVASSIPASGTSDHEFVLLKSRESGFFSFVAWLCGIKLFLRMLELCKKHGIDPDFSMFSRKRY